MAGFYFFVAVFVVVGAAILFNFMDDNKPTQINKNTPPPPKA